MSKTKRVAIIGGGPAGLMAAEVLSSSLGANERFHIDIYDAMPSLGRKFLMAGKGGMNITHAEPFDRFVSRYGTAQDKTSAWLSVFSPEDVRLWMQSLGVGSFVGTSGRVFPNEMKAAPLLRAWLHRLRSQQVHIHVKHRWIGWDNITKNSQTLRFQTPEGEVSVQADALILALGGGSWAKLGSNGAWVSMLAEKQIKLSPLVPSNCGFNLSWSSYFSERYAGEALKNIGLSFQDSDGGHHRRIGECMITQHGIEGSLIYAFSGLLRQEITHHGSVRIILDLLPNKSKEEVLAAVKYPRGSRTLASHLQSRLGLKSAKASMLREVLSADEIKNGDMLAHTIKALPLTLLSARPIDEAISTGGGVNLDELDAHLMLKRLPGVFCAGEMLDWEAPTGGYLLTACLASGRIAGQGVVDWLSGH